MARNRLIPLTSDLEESEGFPLHNCNWCDDKETKAVVAKEHDGKQHRFFGMCGNHAEVSDLRLWTWTAVERANVEKHF